MSRILSQEEIDALLVAAKGTGDADDGPTEQSAASVSTYNFRRPDRVSKEQLRSLHFLHDRFAVNLSTSLSAFLRAVTEVSISSVEQYSYSEFLMSMPDLTAFYAFGLAPLDGQGALEISPAVAFTMVDLMLGGNGQSATPNRALTEIEQNVLDSVVKLMLEHLTETWRPITEVRFKIQGRETRPQMLQVTGPNEIVIPLAFDVRLADTRGTLSICIPASAIESMEDKVQGWHRTRREPTPLEQSRLQANIGRVPLTVSTRIETRLAARELLSLEPGDVLSLGYPAQRPVDVQVGQVRRFSGRLTTVGANAGVTIEGQPHGAQADGSAA